MGNWSEQQEVRKEVKEKDKVRREKLASLFFDLCKVTYTVLVVGLLVTLFQNELYTNYLMIALVVVGVLVAFEFAKIGNNIFFSLLELVFTEYLNKFISWLKTAFNKEKVLIIFLLIQEILFLVKNHLLYLSSYLF